MAAILDLKKCQWIKFYTPSEKCFLGPQRTDINRQKKSVLPFHLKWDFFLTTTATTTTTTPTTTTTTHLYTLFSCHTHTLSPWWLELSAHIYIMEQFTIDIYPLINKNNNVFCVYDEHNIYYYYYRHSILILVSISQYISILFSHAVY